MQRKHTRKLIVYYESVHISATGLFLGGDYESLWLAWPVRPLPAWTAVNSSVVKISLDELSGLVHYICLPGMSGLLLKWSIILVK